MVNSFPASADDQHRLCVDGVRDCGRAFERHFTPKEIAKLWQKDEDTIRKIFRDEPGVLSIPSTRGSEGKRRYVSLTIPESVVVRVHQRLEVKDTEKPKSVRQTKRTRSATDAANRHNAIAIEDSDAESAVDEQWEREVIRTAQRLEDRIRGHGK